MNSAQWRSLCLHAGSAIAGGVAVLGFAASHSVDLYAVYDQANVVVADVTKLIAMLTPIVTGGIAIWKASTRNKIIDVAADPEAPKIAREMPVTPQTVAVAEALQKQP